MVLSNPDSQKVKVERCGVSGQLGSEWPVWVTHTKTQSQKTRKKGRKKEAGEEQRRKRGRGAE